MALATTTVSLPPHRDTRFGLRDLAERASLTHQVTTAIRNEESSTLTKVAKGVVYTPATLVADALGMPTEMLRRREWLGESRASVPPMPDGTDKVLDALAAESFVNTWVRAPAERCFQHGVLAAVGSLLHPPSAVVHLGHSAWNGFKAAAAAPWAIIGDTGRLGAVVLHRTVR